MKRSTLCNYRGCDMCLVLEICLRYILLFLCSGTNHYKKHSRLQLQRQQQSTVQTRTTADRHLPGTFFFLILDHSLWCFSVRSFNLHLFPHSFIRFVHMFPRLLLFLNIIYIFNIVVFVDVSLPIPKEEKFWVYCYSSVFRRRPEKK